MPLFTKRERRDRARLRVGEDWFSFLERVGPDPVFARIRALIDSWIDEVEGSQAETLRRRLLSRNAAVSLPAFWELYLHAALVRSGLRMEYEPPVDGSTKRPDTSFTERTVPSTLRPVSSVTQRIEHTRTSSSAP
jgi:hypothetical protein